MNICIAIWNLTKSAGGLGKVASIICSALVERGHSLIVVANSSSVKKESFYQLPQGTILINSRWIDTKICRKKIREAILATRPDIVIAMSVGAAIRWWPHIMKYSDIPLILSEHSNPWKIEQEMWNRSERQLLMTFADSIHLLFPSYRESLEAHLRERVTIIPNAVSDMIPGNGRCTFANKTVIAVGRLEDDVKQFSILIKAFAEIRHRYPDWKVRIIGGDVDGSEKKYRELIHQFDLANQVELRGELGNLHNEYSNATFLCLPSRYEGFPVTIIEGYDYGLPAIGFRACSGVNELIKDGVTGLLADDMTKASLAQCMSILMDSEAMVGKMGEMARKEARKYRISKICKQWIELIEKTINARKRTRGLQRMNKDQELFLRKRYLNETSFVRGLMKEIFSRLLILTKNNIRKTVVQLD